MHRYAWLLTMWDDGKTGKTEAWKRSDWCCLPDSSESPTSSEQNSDLEKGLNLEKGFEECPHTYVCMYILEIGDDLFANTQLRVCVCHSSAGN